MDNVTNTLVCLNTIPTDVPIGTQIAYIPNHANKNIEHADVEFGFIMRKSVTGRAYFCRFWLKQEPYTNLLRTNANSESVDIRNLYLYDSHDQQRIIDILPQLQAQQLW